MTHWVSEPFQLYSRCRSSHKLGCDRAQTVTTISIKPMSRPPAADFHINLIASPIHLAGLRRSLVSLELQDAAVEIDRRSPTIRCVGATMQSGTSSGPINSKIFRGRTARAPPMRSAGFLWPKKTAPPNDPTRRVITIVSRGFGTPPKRMLCRIATFQQRVPEKNGARRPRIWILHNLELTFKSVFGF